MELKHGQISVDELIQEVRRLAKEYPDAIYQSNNGCFYASLPVVSGPETEGCIIGQALRKFIPIEDSAGIATECKWGNFIAEELALRGEQFTYSDKDEQINWLSVVQSSQDEGYTWSRSVELADEEF